MPFQQPQRQVSLLRAEIDAAIADVLDSGSYILGRHVDLLEKEFADFCGVEHCVTVANGTDALELALRALDVGQGDEVICTANAGGYSATAAMAIGAIPAFADVLESTLLIDPVSAAALMSEKTKAVIVTHLYGRLADVEGVRRMLVSKGSKASIIEDCAQAHGAATKDLRRAGSLGDVGTFSFYPTKNLGGLGDGGSLTTHSPSLAAKLRSLRQYGWSDKYRISLTGGRNSRMDELQAAILRVKLRHVDEGNARRREILNRYAAAARGLTFPHAPAGTDSVVHLCVATTPHRSSVQASLEVHGIATAIHYPIPDHLQRAFVAGRARWRAGPLPVTERSCEEILSIPCYPEMSEAEIAQVCAALAAIFAA